MKKHLKMFVAMMLTLALFTGTFPMAVASDATHAMETPDVSMPEVTEVLTSVDTDSALEEQSPSDAGIALLSLDTETQDNNQILSIHVDEIRISQSFEISWSGVDRIDHYEIAIVRIDENGNETYLTSGTNHRESTGQQTSYTVSAADVPTGTAKFRIYVGAASKAYPCHYSEMLRESTVTVSVYLLETQKELKLNISVQPCYAHITWNNLRRAKYYVYSAYDITSSSYIYNRVETNSLGFELDEDVLISGHKYRIWVGAYNDADELISQKLIDEITPWLACSHPVTMKQDFIGYYKQEEITPQYHILYNGYNIICSSCEEVLEKNLLESLGEEAHQYSPDGVCLICHYANSECTHESTSKKYAPTTYEPENKDTHTMIRRFDVVCDYCSAVIPLRTSESYDLNRTERTKGLAHNFVGKTCAECGYVKADELTLTLQRGQSSAKVGETITASASISGGSGTYKLRWKVYCDDICMNDDVTGAWISAKEHSASYTADRAGSWYFEASVSDSEGESVTAATRTISVTTDECQHDYQTIEQADKLEYIKVNDVQHRVNHYYASVCTLCGDVKNTWIREEFMPHSFDADGKCICGAIKEEDPECVHEWKSVSSDTKIEQSNLNDRMEKHKVTTVYSDVCTKCGSLGNHEIVEYVAHLFDENGNCACGYVKVTEECDHATIGIPEGDPIIKYIDDATHSVTTYERHQCACGQVNELREVTVQAPHTFENGSCVCGAHKHSFEKHHISTTYVNPSNTQHTVTEISQQICSTCSEKLPEEVTTRQETHSFTSKRIAEPTYTNVNDNQHKVTEIYQKTCSVCGYQARETKTWNQNHTFSEPTIDSIHDTAKGGHLSTAKCSVCGEELTLYGKLLGCEKCYSTAFNRYSLYVSSDYYIDGIVYIGTNTPTTIMVYDSLEDKHMRASDVAGIVLALESGYGIASLSGDVVVAQKPGVFSIKASYLGQKIESLQIEATLLSVKDTTFSYNISSSDTVRLEDLANIDWKNANVYITSNINISDFSTKMLPNGNLEVSFKAYNTANSVYGIAVYDANGNQISMKLIEAYWKPNSFYANGWEVLSNTSRQFDKKYSTKTQYKCTSISLEVPAGGHISVVSMGDDQYVFAANVAEAILGMISNANEIKDVVVPNDINALIADVKSFPKDKLYKLIEDSLLERYGEHYYEAITSDTTLAESILKSLFEDSSTSGELLLLVLKESMKSTISSAGNVAEDVALGHISPVLVRLKKAIFSIGYDAQLLHLRNEMDAVLNGTGKIVNTIIVPNRTNIENTFNPSAH